MADDPRHPHLSTGYEHGAATPTPAPAAEAPKVEDKPKPRRKPAAKE